MARAAEANVLEYATPAETPSASGPFLFKFSRATVVLLCLTAATATWLALRHHPWRLAAKFTTVVTGRMMFTPRGDLLNLSPVTGATLYDTNTGRVISNVPLAGSYEDWRVLAGGEQLLLLPPNTKVATLVDVRTGTSQQVALPAPRDRIRAVAPDAPRVIVRSDNHFLSVMEIHSLLPGATTRPTRVEAEAFWIAFSPDGRRILALDPRPLGPDRAATLTLVDGLTGAVIGQPIYAVQLAHPERYFISPDWLLLPRGPDKDPKQLRFDLYSAATGKRAWSVTLPKAQFSPLESSLTISDDGTLLARCASTMTFRFGTNLEVFDAVNGAQLVNRPTQLGGKPLFFPRSRHILADVPGIGGSSLVVLDPRSKQPVAVFPAAPDATFYNPTIRADGLAVAVGTAGLRGSPAQTAVYHKAGWDCPESPLGVLAFPQTWLAVLFFVALVVFGYRDARRARPAVVTADLVPPFLGVVLLVVATPVALATLLAACLGRAVITPAPLLLLAACGLATQNRAWRMVTLVLLYATLLACVYAFHQLSKSAADPFAWTPLDRTYELPRFVPFAAIVVSGLLVAGAITVITARLFKLRV